MSIESVIGASSDVEILQAWTSFLGEMVSNVDAVRGVAVRFVLSRKPKFTCEVACGPARENIEGFLSSHPVVVAECSMPRVVPWRHPVIAFELKDPAAGVYVMAHDDGEIDTVVNAFQEPAMMAALEHSARILDSHVDHIKRVALHSKYACVLVDEFHRVHACNLAAKHLLRDETADLYISTGGELCYRGRGDENQFGSMLDSFFHGGHDEARTLLSNDLLAMVSRDKSSGFSGERLGLVNFKRLRQSLVLDPVRVARITKLTMSQARLVCALVRGQDVKEYTEESGLSLATARWHMRKALQTMECASQFQLVMLMKEIFG